MRPLAAGCPIAGVQGMIIGTLFTLFVVPSIYMLVAHTRIAHASAEVAAAKVDARRSDLSPSPV